MLGFENVMEEIISWRFTASGLLHLFGAGRGMGWGSGSECRIVNELHALGCFSFKLLNTFFRVRTILWLKIYLGFHQYLLRSCPYKGAWLRHENLPQALFAKLWPWEEERGKADAGRAVFFSRFVRQESFSNLRKDAYVLVLMVRWYESTSKSQ